MCLCCKVQVPRLWWCQLSLSQGKGITGEPCWDTDCHNSSHTCAGEHQSCDLPQRLFDLFLSPWSPWGPMLGFKRFTMAFVKYWNLLQHLVMFYRFLRDWISKAFFVEQHKLQVPAVSPTCSLTLPAVAGFDHQNFYYATWLKVFRSQGESRERFTFEVIY